MDNQDTDTTQNEQETIFSENDFVSQGYDKHIRQARNYAVCCGRPAIDNRNLHLRFLFRHAGKVNNSYHNLFHRNIICCARILD